MLSVVLRFQVRDSALPALLVAMRGYQQQSRREPGYVRCELLQDPNQHQTLVLWQVFRGSHARTSHVLTPWHRRWREELAQLVTGSVHEEELETLVRDPVPPPLPVRERPALESSNPFGTALLAVAPSPPMARLVIPQLTLDVEAIEVAAARDHLPLRAPQPCVVLGAFVIDEAGAHGIGRTVYRFAPGKSLPTCLAGAQRLLDVPVLRSQLPLKLAIVVVSVEENGGSDVQGVYAALADAQDLSFWTQNEQCPAPVSLVEGQGLPAFANAAQRVQVLRRAESLADTLTDDTWAGAALGYFDLSQATPEHLARFHTSCDDGKNDWLLRLRCRVI